MNRQAVRQVKRSILTAAAFVTVLGAATSARAEIWKCQYVGSWLTTASGNKDNFSWDIRWTKTDSGWALTGDYQDKYGKSYFDGRCANKSCDFHQTYTTGKLAGKTYYYSGTYRNKSVGSSSSITAFDGTWGYTSPATDGGTWQAVATCAKTG